MDNSQICEHSVKQKLEGKWILRRVLLIALYVFIGLVAALLGLIFKNPIPFIVVGGILIFALHLLLWRMTKLEYEYSMTGGELVFSRIYGGAARRIVFRQNLNEIDAAFPYKSEKGTKRMNEYAPEVQYFALSTQDEEENAGKEIWCCLFENDEGKRSAFFFELTDKAYRMLRFYASAATAARREE